MTKSAATSGGATQTTTYTYDVWGNRWPLNGGMGGGVSFTYNDDNHNGLFTYDAAGNVMSNGSVDSTYDAERRVRTVSTHGTTQVVTGYVYGPEGDRVMATRGSNKVEYFYGPGGTLTSTWANGVVKKANVNTVLGKVAAYVSGSLQYEFHD